MAFYLISQSDSFTATRPLLVCNDGGIEGREGMADVSERRIRGSGGSEGLEDLREWRI